MPRQWVDRLEQEAVSRQCREVLSEAPDHQQLPTGLLYRQVQKLAQLHTDRVRERQQFTRMFDGIDPDGEGARVAGSHEQGPVGPLQPGAHTLWRFGVGQSIVPPDQGLEGCLRVQGTVGQAKASSEEALGRYEAVIHGRHDRMSRDARQKLHLYDSRKALLRRAEEAGLISPVAEERSPMAKLRGESSLR